jgi:hypothetical protein
MHEELARLFEHMKQSLDFADVEPGFHSPNLINSIEIGTFPRF